MIIVVDPERAFRLRAQEQLAYREDLVQAETLAELSGLVAERADEVTVVVIGPSVDEPVEVARALQAEVSDISVVLFVSTLDTQILQDALRGGIRDVLSVTARPFEFISAVKRAEDWAEQMRARTARPEPVAPVPVAEAVPDAAPPLPTPPTTGRVITTLSSKGGVGKSFVASNISLLLSGRASVAVVDLDLQSGDLAIMLQLTPGKTICDAAADLAHLDADALKSYLTKHQWGPSFLPAPVDPAGADSVTAEQVQQIIGMLKERYDYVVIDTPPSFSDHVLTAVDESDLVIAITTMDVPSIKNLRLAIQTLSILGVSRDRLRVVLNRADSRVGLDQRDVEKTLDARVDVPIPSSREVPLSINRGTPIVLEYPKSPVTHALVKLADSIHPVPEPVAQQSSGRDLFGRKR